MSKTVKKKTKKKLSGAPRNFWASQRGANKHGDSDLKRKSNKRGR